MIEVVYTHNFGFRPTGMFREAHSNYRSMIYADAEAGLYDEDVSMLKINGLSVVDLNRRRCSLLQRVASYVRMRRRLINVPQSVEARREPALRRRLCANYFAIDTVELDVTQPFHIRRHPNGSSSTTHCVFPLTL